MDHETLVGFARSWGLFYLIALAVGVLIYAFWPSNRKRFQRAKTDILTAEDRPAGPETEAEAEADKAPDSQGPEA